MTTHHDPLRIAYVGNFQPEHSTENHVRETLRRMGHEVLPLQENDPTMWLAARSLLHDDERRPDVLLWTRTGWEPPVPLEDQLAVLAAAQSTGVPTVGFHLDRWWGLNREPQISEQPFFQCDLVCTADGGNDDRWTDAGVEHLWLPPAVAEFECGWGYHDPRMASEVAFVGSWESYHAEWPWRRRLVRLLGSRYGARQFRTWPERGEAVRGARLRNLYASATVIVGDSCLAGGATRYWSDRIPETLGRGGLLIHPWVEGLEDSYTDHEHLMMVEPESIEAMFSEIDTVLAMPYGDQMEIRRAGMLHVMEHHTYRQRMETLLGELEQRNLLAVAR